MSDRSDAYIVSSISGQNHYRAWCRSIQSWAVDKCRQQSQCSGLLHPFSSPGRYNQQHSLARRMQPRWTRRHVIIGISGFKGTGKPTISALLATSLTGHGFRRKNISLDDFYLKNEDRQALQSLHTERTLLRTRGQPDTHDLIMSKSLDE